MTLRRVLLLAVLCAWHSTVVAQITVTSATFPVLGDTLHGAQAVSPGPLGTFGGPPGFNIHWDASSLLPGQRIQTLFRSPSTGVYSARFPNANLMTGNGIAETYYRTSNGKLEILGVAGNARGAPTDSFGLDWVAVFSPSQVQRPSTINFFDIRAQSINTVIQFPSTPGAYPESLRSIFSSVRPPFPPYQDVPPEGFRVSFTYSLLDTVDGSGDLKLPGVLTPAPVLRIKRTSTASGLLDAFVLVPADPTPVFVWENYYLLGPSGWGPGTISGGPPLSDAWLTFLDAIKTQLDAQMDGIIGGGGLAPNLIGTTGFQYYAYQFLSATDKEELAVARVDPAQGLLSVTFKDFNPPPPTTLIVTKTADTNDGVCDADCSLREALAVAGSNGAVDIIRFNIPANDPDCFGNHCSIALTGPLAPAADGGLLTSIEGGTATNTVTLSGTGATRILIIGTGVNLSAKNMNFIGGYAHPTVGAGGAIRITQGGTLALSNACILGSAATIGGAIFADSGTTLALTNVTITGNNAFDAGLGGGIYNSGTVTATNCTITNNTATSHGGVVTTAGATFNIRNTIIAKNFVTSLSPDANGNFTSQGHNLIGDAAGANGFTATGDLTGVDLFLWPLSNNGGPTLTHALLFGSPAINAGDNTHAPVYDQRYLLRNGTSDIGAYEYDALTPSLKITSIARPATGDILLQGLGVPNAPHTVQVSLDLTSGFSFLGTVASDATGNLQYGDEGAIGATRRFYRFTFP